MCSFRSPTFITRYICSHNHRTEGLKPTQKRNMPRKLWGEFTEANKAAELSQKVVPIAAKRAKLDEMRHRAPVSTDINVTIKVKNPLVTQSIEVMKQTEMLQSLIDTYSQKSGTSNYLLNPCQMIPEVDFPPENAVDFVSDDKFAKPIWFIPPLDTDFARGVPKYYAPVSADVCRAAFRKAICGQLRVAGFADAAESALVLFADAIEEFVRNFMQQIRVVHANNPELERRSVVEVRTLEKAYYAQTNASLTEVHNYYKHQLIARNRTEIAEFKGVLQEYAKLMKESQSMQQKEFQESDDYLNILEMPQSNEQPTMTTPTPSTSGAAAAGMADLTGGSAGSVAGSNALLTMFEA